MKMLKTSDPQSDGDTKPHRLDYARPKPRRYWPNNFIHGAFEIACMVIGIAVVLFLIRIAQWLAE